MAILKWTVFFNLREPATPRPAANWKEKDIVVKGGLEKNNGLFASAQTVSIVKGDGVKSGGWQQTKSVGNTVEQEFNSTLWKTNRPKEANFVTIEAESASEAIKAVREFYGPGLTESGLEGAAALSSNLEESTYT